ncbi:hypothetical protein [Algoriphagus sp. CAU 1675]|uniref:hypothetical protein n=1 Tax=Algoriphagus sp. CAU 1675 TaxID=3032597 RepID=UPI0023D9AFDE|nr:hypothetical protein [Algoriphagus sp. CAU 1675]MDF2156992.1 hypothetical protein [Algoriphagus sp. CAU 1675]
MNQFSFALLFFGILFFSYSQKNNKKLEPEIQSKHYQLTVVDSIQIPYLGRPILQDISPYTQKILFIESGEYDEEIFTANFQGEIIHSFIANGNTIVGHLRRIAPLHLVKDGSLILSFGNPQVKKISLDGSEVETIFTGVPPYYSSFPSPTNEIIIRDNKIFYNNRSDDGNYNRYQKEYLKNLKLIGYLDLEKSEITNFLSFPEESIFQNGLIFPHSTWVSHFIFSQNKLIVAFEGESALFVFDGEAPFSFEQKIALNLGDFKSYKGHPEGEEGMDLMEALTNLGKIESIKKTDEYILIGYKRGFNNQQIRKLETATSPQERWKMIQEFEKENPSRIQLLDENLQFLDDFPKPQFLNISSLMVREGYLWGSKSDPDSEEDHFTIYKLEVQEK